MIPDRSEPETFDRHGEHTLIHLGRNEYFRDVYLQHLPLAGRVGCCIIANYMNLF